MSFPLYDFCNLLLMMLPIIIIFARAINLYLNTAAEHILSQGTKLHLICE